MKLERFIQKAGIASRRKAPELIKFGRVKVNSKVVTDFYADVDENCDVVQVDGRDVSIEEKRYYLFNKPMGYITAMKDPFKTPTVMDYLKAHHDISVRVHPVGRLDKDTEGLLLLTNDGDLTYKVLHPKMKVEKEYLARVRGTPESNDIKMFSEGMTLKSFSTAPASLEIVRTEQDFSWIKIVIREGKKRQVKRMCSFIGHKVVYLQRIRVGTFSLSGIEKAGTLKKISKEDIESFLIDNDII